MEVFFDARKIKDDRPVVLTLGNFDGFHVGHQEIVRRTVCYGREKGFVSLLITLHPHPRQLFAGDLSMITPLEDKLELLSEASLDRVLVFPFTRTFASTSAESFIRDILIGQLNARHIVVGYDWNFGRNARGNPGMIEEIGSGLGVSSEVVPAVTIEGEIASSTAVRRAIGSGNLARAEQIMGRRYGIKGRQQQGEPDHDDGFFTFPVVFPDQVILPPPGAYLVHMGAQDPSATAVAVFPDKQVKERPGCLIVSPNPFSIADRRWIRLEFSHNSALLFHGQETEEDQRQNSIRQARALLSRHNVLK